MNCRVLFQPQTHPQIPRRRPKKNEERLVEALRSLPPDTAQQVITWTTRFRDLANGKNVDWSDTWTKEDLADVQRASLSRFDEMDREAL
jgi:hypothetical protein